MNDHPRIKAIGLMSGTSLDGIDAALIDTDGERVFERGTQLTRPYAPELREKLRAALGRSDRDAADLRAVEAEMTDAHADVVRALLAEAALEASAIGVVGFHGQTLLHRPENGLTVQIGDGQRLATALGIPVVFDLRSADVAAGGQGAPLASIYHRAMVQELHKPVAVLNLGGVANVTWIGAAEGDLLAFDTGPANALMDDWVRRHTGDAMDEGGALAAKGRLNEGCLMRLMDHPYFAAKPPKSLDRDDFAKRADEALVGLSLEDGLATLLAFTERTVSLARRHFPETPKRWFLSGGGRRNRTLVESLERTLGGGVYSVDNLGWNGDSVEAEAFAYLAARHCYGLPITFPGTTGAPRPLIGGVLAQPA